MPGANGATTPEIQAIQKRLSDKILEGKTILAPYSDKAVPEEVQKQVTAVFGEIDGLKATLGLHQQQKNAEELLNQPTTNPVAWRPAMDIEGQELPVDTKEWRQFEVKNALGQPRNFRYMVPLGVYANTKGFKGINNAVLTDKQYQIAYRDGHEMFMRKGAAFVKENYPIEYKALSEGSDLAGGFSVPVDFHAELIKKIAMQAMVRPNARVIQTNRDLVVFPRINYSSTQSDDSGNKRYTSPVRMNWTGETPASATSIRVSDQVLGQYEIKVNTAIASQLLSNDLIEDAAFDIAGYASDTMAEAFALGEDYAFLQGSGVAQPMGLMTQAGATNGIPYMPSGTSAQIFTGADTHSGQRVLDVFYNLPAQYRRNAMWLMTSLTEEAVENLVDNNKRPIINALLTASIAIGQPDVIKARPVMVDEFMPEIAASSFPLVLGDFGGYMIVDRVQFSVQRNADLYMETNFTLLLARKRVGGLCIEPWKFMAMKAATS